MKKILSLILALSLIFALSACGEKKEKEEATQSDIVATPEPTEEPCEHVWEEATLAAPETCSICGETRGEPLVPYFEEKGFAVSAIGTLASVGISYADEDLSQHKEMKVTTVVDSMSRTPADEEGYEIISLKLVTECTATYGLATKLNYTFTTFDSNLYDYYTGQSYGGQNTINDGGYDIGKSFEFGGKTYDVAYSSTSEWFIGDWVTLESGDPELIKTCITNYTFKVPTGYDGIVYAAMPSPLRTEDELNGIDGGEYEDGGIAEGDGQYFRVNP